MVRPQCIHETLVLVMAFLPNCETPPQLDFVRSNIIYYFRNVGESSRKFWLRLKLGKLIRVCLLITHNGFKIPLAGYEDMILEDEKIKTL